MRDLITPLRHPAAAEGRQRAPAPAVYPALYAALLAWVAGMLLLARAAEPAYRALMQEDYLVEWATVGAFLLAGVVGLRAAVVARRPFDALVALFCLFVAAEEMSWGQRLVGYTPPPLFLEHNAQQELTLHNFASVFGAPRWTLVAALAGYGLVLPAAARVAGLRRVIAAIGATAPALSLVPWFAAAIALLVWYPVTFTGEWVELLAGSLFATAAWPPAAAPWRAGAALLGGAVAMTWLSGHARGGAHQLACARAEATALASDLASDLAGGAAPRLLHRRRVHKRVQTLMRDGDLAPGRLRAFGAVTCPGVPTGGAPGRRRFAVDPWGTAYWVRIDPRQGSAPRLAVYSFGPNRRRDGESHGDDVWAVAGE